MTENLEPVKQKLNTESSWPPTLLSEEKKAELRKQLEVRRDEIKLWAPTCNASISNPPEVTGPNYPGTRGKYSDQISQHPYDHSLNGHNYFKDCEQWDTNDESGLLCLAAFVAGDDETLEYRCRDVRIAQAQDGRWFRGFMRMGIEKWMCDHQYRAPDGDQKGTLLCPEYEAFSRDALEGTIAYWIATKDVESAQQWLSWIRDVNKNSAPGEFHMCSNYASSTNICLITPGTWGELGKVWQHLGLPLEPEMIQYANTAAFTSYASLGARPAEFTLVADEIWMRRVLKKLSDVEINVAEQKAYDAIVAAAAKKNPLNAQIYYLKNGVNEELVNRLLKYCPSIEPNYDQIYKPYSTEFPIGIPTWSWGRDDQYQPWLYSGGHDCIFMLDVAIGDLNLY